MPRPSAPQTANTADAPSRQPTLFVSFPSRYDFQIQQLVEALRKAEVQVFAYPQDLDETGAKLVAAVRRQGTKPLVLGIVMAPDDTTFTNVVGHIVEQLEDSLRDLIVLQLSASDPLPAELADSKRYDLTGSKYQRSFVSLLKAMGKSLQAPVRARAQFLHVSGIFEVARPQSEMFAELKEQISKGKIDQKYLYWDVRASLRWQEIAELSTYMTAQGTMNLLAANADAMFNPMLAESKDKRFSFINFGVGTGVKDYLILDALLKDKDAQVAYFPVDESLSMMQITIQSMQELIAQYADRLHFQYILDAFENADRFRGHITRHEHEVFNGAESTRIVALLGGSLGNFDEHTVLEDIKTLLGHRGDRLILGVEFIADRSDDELIENYEDERMKRFLYGPILDIQGVDPGWEHTFRYETLNGRSKRSAVPGAKTIIGSVELRSDLVELFYASKYDQESFDAFIKDEGFEIEARFLSDDIPARFAKYVLKRGR
jgi:histidine-specific SAM-dependent methyltransferase